MGRGPIYVEGRGLVNSEDAQLNPRMLEGFQLERHARSASRAVFVDLIHTCGKFRVFLWDRSELLADRLAKGLKHLESQQAFCRYLSRIRYVGKMSFLGCEA